MKMKRFFVTLLFLSILVGLTSSAFAAEAPKPGLHLLENLGYDGSKTYVYIPNELYQPSPMLTEVIYVYGDSGVESEDAAMKLLNDTGLIDIAEESYAVIIVMNPAEATWGQNDMYIYQAVMDHILFSAGDMPLTFFTLQYMIGEGRGASFINRYITQQPGRVAGVALFGGIMPVFEVGPALPAYIVGGSPAAVDYYKKANETASIELGTGKTVYYNSANYAQRVTVSESKGTSFDKGLIADAHETMFSKIMRQGLRTPIFWFTETQEVFTLFVRPEEEKLGLTRVDVLDTKVADQPRWYEWVPNEVFSGMASGSDKKYPLVVSLHGGGDHPLYEAESNGWIKLAGEERVIVIAPENTAVEPTMGMLDTVLKKYPIDRTRMYVTGFSAGGTAMNALVSVYPDLFTAASPMAPSRMNMEVTPEQASAADLPLIYVIGSLDRSGAPLGHLSDTRHPLVVQMRGLNNIKPFEGELDIETYPFWGFPTVNHREFVTQHGFTIKVSGLTNDAGVEMIRLACAVGLNHTHYFEYARLAWDFFEQFSRDPETKELFLNGVSISK